MLKLWALAGAFCLWGAVAGADVAETPAAPRDSAKVPQSIWQVAPDGTATHLQSTLVCPPELGDFHQGKLITYDNAGFDVSCGFVARDGWITVYLTRLGPNRLDDVFADGKRQIVEHTPDATALPDAEQKIFDSNFNFLHLTYTQQNGAMWSGIWMTEISGWMFEFRATYRPEAQQKMFDAMAELTRRVAETAAKHLAICAKAAPVVRDGVAVTDKDVLQKAMMMATLFGAVRSEADKKEIQKPVHWCAERNIGPAPGVFWHAVYDDGSDALADRITPESVDDPVALMSAPNLMAALLSDGKEANNGPQWFVSLKVGNKTWFFAIYQSRPSVEALAQILSDIAGHKARSIGGYSVDGKNVTIDMPAK